MILIPLIEKLRSRFQTEQLTAEADWQTIVSKVADCSATEIEITKAMKASGRSLSDLESAVTREQRIGELRAVAEQLSDAAKASEAAQAAHSSFLERRLEVIAKLRDENFVLVTSMQNTQSIVDQCRAAQVELESMLDA